MPTTNGLPEDYETLGLRNDATLDEVKQAYRDLVKVWHPDRFNQDDTRLRKKANQKQQEINDAYRNLFKALTPNPQQGASSDRETPLNEAVDTITAFILLINSKVTILQMKIMTGSASRREIDSAAEEFTAINREAVGRVELLIQRFEREVPEYPRTQLESILVTLAQQKSVVNKAIAALSERPSESHREARRTTRPPSASTNPPSSAGNAKPTKSSSKPYWMLGILSLVGATVIFVIIAGNSSVPSLPPANNSASTSSGIVAPKPAPTVEAQPPDTSSSTANDDNPMSPGEAIEQESGNKAAIQQSVEAWANAFRARDTVALAGYYAPVVEQYFRKKNFTRTQVQESFESGFANIANINRYEITDLSVDFIGGSSRATASFNKQWDTSQTDGKTFSGEEIEQLTFENTDEGWKIVREEELNIIRATRQ